MAERYERVFWQSRMSAAFRTGSACLLAWLMMQYSDMHSQWMAFPLFAYIMAVTVVGEASLGEALRSSFSVMAGVIHGAIPAILVLWVIKPERFNTWVTTLCVTVSSFFIVGSKMIHITSKRVACAQLVMIYVSAFSKRENLDPVMYPLRVAATTVVGTACALLALVFPVPRLAIYQVQEKSKLTALITSEVLRILVEAFNTNDYREVNSLLFQAKSVSSTGISMLEKVQDKQDYIRWELPGLGYSSSVKAISKFTNMRQSLAGMEIALQYSSNFEIGPLMHSLLKDPVLYLAERTSLALNHAGSISFTRRNRTNQEELIVENVSTALNSLDEALTILTQRAYQSTMQKPIPTNKSFGHEKQSSDAFRCYLPTFFFMFNLKSLSKEATDVLSLSNPGSEKLQQIVLMVNAKQEIINNTSSQNDSDHCRLCAVSQTTISINIDATQQESQTKTILDRIRSYCCQMYRERLVVALKCSLSMGLSVLTGILISQKHGFWGGIAVAMSLSSSREATFKLGNVRAQGTVAGSIYGVITGFMIEKYMVLGIVALIPWVIFTSFLRHSKMYGYAGGLSAVISAVFILGRKTSSNPSEFAIERITETMVGTVCYMVVELILQPRRAATIAREELILTLSHIQEYTAAIISAQIAQRCIHSLPETLLQLKEKEKALKHCICRLRRSIEEAKTEPGFWFLPFPETAYSKLMGDVCNIADLLNFSVRAYESIIESCSNGHISTDAIYDLIRDDLQEFGYRVSAPFECFVQVLQVKSIPELFIHHQHHDRFADVEHGPETLPAHEEHPHDFELEYQNSQSIAGDDQDAIDSLLKGIKVLVANVCLNDRDVGGLNNDLIIALGALVFCMDGIMKELNQAERDIHEILQWENPWSLIDMWEIRSMLNKEVSY